jgi:hypothetical protein
MLIEVTEGAEAETEGRARRLLLDLFELTMRQPTAWVLVATLTRRLGPLSTAQPVLARAELSRWLDFDGPSRMRRVRLSTEGRALFERPAIHGRPRAPEPRHRVVSWSTGAPAARRASG